MEHVKCANCGDIFKKFRKKPPNQTCKKCIMAMWHIPLEKREYWVKGQKPLNAYLIKTKENEYEIVR